MKAHLLLFCAAALLLAGCAATKQTSEQRAAEQAAIAKSVREQVPAASFKIVATEMIPLRAPSKTLTDPYFVKVSDNYLESALPYFGRATNIPYGGGNALDFKTEITSYDWKEVKPGVFDIKIFVFCTIAEICFFSKEIITFIYYTPFLLGHSIKVKLRV